MKSIYHILILYQILFVMNMVNMPLLKIPRNLSGFSCFHLFVFPISHTVSSIAKQEICGGTISAHPPNNAGFHLLMILIFNEALISEIIHVSKTTISPTTPGKLDVSSESV